MSEPASREFPRFPSGLIGMLALLVLVESWIGRHASELRPLIAWNNMFAHQAARVEAPRAKILFLGDSFMKLGVLPAVVERRSGRSAYNLGVIGSEPSVTYFLLRQALNQGARPEAIVVDFAPNLAKADPRLYVDEKSEAMELGDILDLALSTRSFTYAGRLLLAKSFASIRYRTPVREQIAASLTAVETPSARALRLDLAGRQYLRHWSVNRGGNANSIVGALAAGEDSPYLDPPWSVHSLNQIYISRLFRLAESRKIPIFWLIPTFADETQRRREALGVDAAFLGFAARMQARYPGVRLLDARHLGLDRAMFSDPGHLNAKGAVAQSDALAEALAAQLSSPGSPRRWVELARVGSAANAPPVEDFESSCRIIAEKEAERLQR